jgi:hypothetical protein
MHEVMLANDLRDGSQIQNPLERADELGRRQRVREEVVMTNVVQERIEQLAREEGIDLNEEGEEEPSEFFQLLQEISEATREAERLRFRKEKTRPDGTVIIVEGI